MIMKSTRGKQPDYHNKAIPVLRNTEKEQHG